MNREAELEISGIDWLCLKLMPEDGIRLESEARLADWKMADWEKIANRCCTGHDWCELLKFCPALVDKCDWQKLRKEDWGRLLLSQPHHRDKCPFLS